MITRQGALAPLTWFIKRRWVTVQQAYDFGKAAVELEVQCLRQYFLLIEDVATTFAVLVDTMIIANLQQKNCNSKQLEYYQNRMQKPHSLSYTNLITLILLDEDAGRIFDW